MLVKLKQTVQAVGFQLQLVCHYAGDQWPSRIKIPSSKRKTPDVVYNKDIIISLTVPMQYVI